MGQQWRLGGPLDGVDLSPGVRSGERFFQLLDQLKPNPGNFLPVLELMYLCLSLGFQGQYRLSPRGPGELDRIREDLYTIIVRQRQAADPALSPHWQGVPAPYKPARVSWYRHG